MPCKILSTKKLSLAQKEAFSEFYFREEKFIKVSLENNIKIPEEIDCAIFTSQNAVKAVFREAKIVVANLKKVFCVGDKTARSLKEFGIEVHAISYSAEELAELLIEEKKETKITFFCGNLRREELPELLRENNIEVEEIEVYKTELLQPIVEEEFDAILFFSPSAVKSYIDSGNSIKSTAFCIGNTTAVAAIMKFENVYVADRPTVEEVIKSVKENIN